MSPTDTLPNLTDSASGNLAQYSKSFWRNAVTKKILNFDHLVGIQFSIVSLFASNLSFILVTIFRVLSRRAFVQMIWINTPAIIALMQNHIWRKIAGRDSHRQAMGGNLPIFNRDLAIAFCIDSALPIPTTVSIKVRRQMHTEPIFQYIVRHIKRQASQSPLIARTAQFKCLIPNVVNTIFSRTFHSSIIASEVATA